MLRTRKRKNRLRILKSTFEVCCPIETILQIVRHDVNFVSLLDGDVLQDRSVSESLLLHITLILSLFKNFYYHYLTIAVVERFVYGIL